MGRSPKTTRRDTRAAALQESPVAPSAGYAKLRAPVRPRAFELLAAQPVSLIGLSQAARDLIVVTAVADEQGNEHVVSRFGDPTWNMASEVEAKNRQLSECVINWPDDVPKALVDDAKAALYCALRRGPYDVPWTGSHALGVVRDGARCLRRLASLGLRNFGEVRALHLSDYIAELRGLNLPNDSTKTRRPLAPSTVKHTLAIADLVWHFPMEVFHPLPEHPWAGDSLSRASGCRDEDGDLAGRAGKTAVIPREVQRVLYAYCEARLDEAEALFKARDAGRITAFSYELTAVRDVVLYLTQVTSGMRNSESTGITSGCWRTEVKNGITFHWVRTREIKTGQGEVDYLVPPQALRALEILQSFAEPLQARLADEASWLEEQLRQGPNDEGLLDNGMTVADAVHRFNHVREIGKHLFLGKNAHRSDHLGTGRVEVMSVRSCLHQLSTLAGEAGTDWALANHQCRRTFAYNVANSKLGHMGLVFLKWQLKHASMSWTQLYAANPRQDRQLYRLFEEESVAARIPLMEGWFDPDARLSGGAGKKLMQMRATPVRDMKELLTLTAEAVEIRSTGHAWCLSGTRGCSGQGPYDPSKCAGCSGAVIDSSQAPTWQMIHLDNLRLAAISDCGPAVKQKAERALRRSEQVLQDLGIPLPNAEQAEAYARDGRLA
jgi:Phage integrase family